MGKRKLVQVGNILYKLEFFAEIDSPSELNKYLNKYDVRLLKESD